MAYVPVCLIMSGVLALKYSTAGVDGDEINKTSVGIAKAGEDGDAVHVYGFGLAETEEDGYEQGWIHGYPSPVRVGRISAGKGHWGIWAGAVT